MTTEEILPIDDIRHCPAWLRISDGVKKEPAKVSTVKRVDPKTKFQPKKIQIYLHGEKTDHPPMKISEAGKLLNYPVNTIGSNIKSGGTTRDGYSFKVVEETKRLEE